MSCQHIQTKIDYFKKLKEYTAKELEQLEMLKQKVSQTNNLGYLQKLNKLKKIIQLRQAELQSVIHSHKIMLMISN